MRDSELWVGCFQNGRKDSWIEDSQEVALPIAAAQNSTPIPKRAPTWALAMGRINHFIMNDFGGGRRLLKLAWVINFQKLATVPLLGLFMVRYHNVRASAWIYLAMQGTYGLV